VTPALASSSDAGAACTAVRKKAAAQTKERSELSIVEDLKTLLA